MVEGNFFCTLRDRAPEGSRRLLTDEQGRLHTYADLDRESAKYANALLGLGLKPGDRVSVQIEKSVENLWLYLATLRAGLVFHPLNTAYSEQEIAYFLENAEPALVICDPRKEQGYRVLCDGLGISHLLTLDSCGGGSFAGLAAKQANQFDTVPRKFDDLAVLLYSSGTTGRPKGIMLTHENLRSNAAILAEQWGFSAEDVLLHCLPIFHVHGLFVAIHCVLMSGASMEWLPGFDREKVRERLPRCTVMMGVPTYYTRLLADPDFDKAECSSMRLFISGSAPLLEETFNAFSSRTGHTILERYGMSETGMNSANPLEGERRAGTVGFPLPGTEIRICSANHEPVAEHDIGEIEVRGPNVFAGYWRMPEKTREDFTDDGWFVTGDQGRIDEQGYLAIVGRSKDMVITGGLNVYPKEVESLLNGMEGVAESAVFGVPDDDFGEAVVAAVVPEADSHLDPERIRAELAEQIAKFKVPKRIQLVESLPRNTMGKVQKNLLRDGWA
jgi:malonyl-CoA/methylmalonyl-CoA synthetase